MNIERLKQLRAHEQDKKLVMGAYSCNSAHCHAGWVAELAGALSNGGVLSSESRNSPYIWDFAAAWLDLTETEAWFLFYQNSHWRDVDTCSDTEGRARLNHLIRWRHAPDNPEEWATRLELSVAGGTN